MGKEYTVSIVVLGKDKASQVLGGIGKGLQTLGTAAIGLGVGAVAGTAALGVGLTKLAIDAAPMEGIEQAFYNIAEASGESGDRMLEALKKGSAGMITQRDLMEKYNLAAQLVGDQFANELPNAMEYLTKVSAATGQDMGYMMDSLVRGVGRLSPMILDNLGIQVDLTTANEEYAQSLGKSVDEMTKQEQQAALMAQVMQKLAENTAAMPDVVGSAAQKMAAFKVTLQDVKDRIGMAMLPALSALLEPLGKVAEAIGPKLIPLAEQLGTWLGENLPKAIDALVGILSGETPAAFEGVLAVLQQVADVFIGQVWPALQQAFASITEALNTLGLDWADVFTALLTSAAIVVTTLIALFTGIVAAIAGVVEHVANVMADMADTFMRGLEAISQIVGGVMAIIQGIISGDLDLILAGVSAFGEGVVGLFTAMGEGILNAINLTFGTIITAVVTFVETVINFFVGLRDTLVGGSIVQGMMDSMLEIIQGGLSAIIGAITSFIADVISAFSGLAGTLRSIGENIMESLKEGIMSKVNSIISAIRNAISQIISEAEGALDIFSPSGVFMEMGRRMMEGMALGIAGSAGMPAAAMVSAAAGTVKTTNNYFNLTVHSRAETSQVIQSFQTMRALVGS